MQDTDQTWPQQRPNRRTRSTPRCRAAFPQRRPVATPPDDAPAAGSAGVNPAAGAVAHGSRSRLGRRPACPRAWLPGPVTGDMQSIGPGRALGRTRLIESPGAGGDRAAPRQQSAGSSATGPGGAAEPAACTAARRRCSGSRVFAPSLCKKDAAGSSACPRLGLLG